MMKLQLSAVAVLVAMVVPSAQAVQIALTPANVIGGSGSYNFVNYNAGQFQAGNILDQQTGAIVEPDQNNNDANGGYWINSDGGPANAYIVVDLGQAYQLGRLDLFNTHNAQFNDRGTGQFQIVGGNAVTNLGAAGFDLTGPTSVLVNGALAAEVIANDPLNAQSFNVSNTSTFRYLRFNPLTVAAGGTPCCGANVYGLNELRAFTADVPEPSMALLALVGAGSLMMRRRRA